MQLDNMSYIHLHHTPWRNTNALRWWCCTNHTLLLHICDWRCRGLYLMYVCRYRNNSSTLMDKRPPTLNNTPPTNTFLHTQTTMYNKVQV